MVRIIADILSSIPVEEIDSQRIRKKALSRFVEKVTSECPKNKEAFLNVQHGGAYDEARSLSTEPSKKTGIKDIPITDLPPAILVHGGPDVLGVSFFKK